MAKDLYSKTIKDGWNKYNLKQNRKLPHAYQLEDNIKMIKL